VKNKAWSGEAGEWATAPCHGPPWSADGLAGSVS
jgi:hypothetical protein